MTKRQNSFTSSPNCTAIGNIIADHRLALNLQHFGRQAFINNRVDIGLLPEGWISVKSLTNIENGNNIPSLPMLYQLSIALEIDFKQLVCSIEQYL